MFPYFILRINPIDSFSGQEVARDEDHQEILPEKEIVFSVISEKTGKKHPKPELWRTYNQRMFLALNLFCAISFLGYGLSCLTTKYMVQEFERYRVAKIRKLTGFSQILAAFGLITGLSIPVIGALASGGLTLQMIIGFGVRLKIRDPFLKCLPALFYLILSAWLCLQFTERVSTT